MQLASHFHNKVGIRSGSPLSEEMIRRVAPSIFADAVHESRSERYAYVPTIDVLNRLRGEGFEPFSVCQTRTRSADRRDFTKHMIRLRHADQIAAEGETNEIVLLNSHDGTSSYQMLAGMFRFVCSNGMVCGTTVGDIRVRHKGDIVGDVIEGAFRVLDSFEETNAQRDAMQGLTLNAGEQSAFARAALALKYDEDAGPAPITEVQVLLPRRFEDRRDDMWTTFNRVQENLMKGGLPGRSKTGQRRTTRPVQGIDQSVKLNRALWVLAEEMRKLKA